MVARALQLLVVLVVTVEVVRGVAQGRLLRLGLLRGPLELVVVVVAVLELAM